MFNLPLVAIYLPFNTIDIYFFADLMIVGIRNVKTSSDNAA